MNSLSILNAIIVDDEELARKNLQLLIEEYCPEINIIDLAKNITEAQEKITTQKPDVVFLDIRMPSGVEGFELLKKIPKREFQVVFVTAFKDYAIQAFNANAIHYILKPIDINDLQNAVKKIMEYQQMFISNIEYKTQYQNSVNQLSDQMLSEEKPNRITLFHSKGFKFIETNTIVRLEAKGNYTIFYFNDGNQYMDSKTLKVNQELLSSNFIRVHKSHLINLDFLTEYHTQDGHFACLSDGSEIPISRGRLSEFITRVKSGK